MASEAKVEPIDDIYKFIDENKALYIERLKEAVAIPSVSGEPEHRPDVFKMMEWGQKWAGDLGAKTRMVTLPMQELPDGSSIPLPPVLLAQFGDDPSKPTLLCYGHLDVQPASKDDGWNTEPFELTEVDGKMFGRGTTDDKGPVLGWLWVVEAHKKLGKPLPVNLRLVCEGMEESGSIGLEAVLRTEGKEGGFCHGCDYVCISDNYWLGKKKPCLTYGLRGIAYFYLSCQCSTKDLHSGVHGGAVSEAMTDCIKIMGSLVNTDGKIAVEGIYDEVRGVTEVEDATYKTMDFSVEQYKKDVGVHDRLLHDKERDVLMHRWRYPSLSLHGIEGAWSGSGGKTVIPAKVVGKFSIRLVPDMDPKRVEELVVKHVNDMHAKSGSPNKVKVEMHHGAKAWLSPVDHPNYVAGIKAMKDVWGVEPDLTREGGSIPITLVFEEVTGRNVLLLPMGACDDGAHSQNEKLDIPNYINGIKVFAAYMTQLGASGKQA